MTAPYPNFPKVGRFYYDDRNGERWRAESARRMSAADVSFSAEEAASPRFPTNAHAVAAVFHRYGAAFEFLSKQRWGTIIDVGCGHGLPAWLMSDVADRVIGLDTDAGRIAVARGVFPEVEYHASTLEAFLAANPTVKPDIITAAYVPVEYADVRFAKPRYFIRIGYYPPNWKAVYDPRQRLAYLNQRYDTAIFGEGCRGFAAAYLRGMFHVDYLSWIKRVRRKRGYLFL